MLVAHRHEEDLDSELAALRHRHSGLLHQRRMEFLGDRLSAGQSLAVQHNTAGFSGDRIALYAWRARVLPQSYSW